MVSAAAWSARLQMRRARFNWGFEKTSKLLFLPDQHLGRNTGYKLGIPLNEMVVWDPYMLNGRPDPSGCGRRGSFSGRGTARCTSAFFLNMWTMCARNTREFA